jgi:Tfp pilus assembly protein PilF
MKFFSRILLILALLLACTGCGKSDVEKSKEFIKADKFPQAIELLSKRVAQNPEDAEAHFLLGVAFINADKLAEADEQFAIAVRLNSDFGPHIGREYKKAGDIALKAGQTDKAIGLFQNAVRRQPDLKKSVARTLYERGKDLSLAGNENQVIELHQYAIVQDPLLGKDMGAWYAVKAENAETASEQADLRRLASQFATAYKMEHRRIQQAAAKQEAEKGALSVRAKLEWALERRVDEHAWQRRAVKASKTLDEIEIVQWSVKYYQNAGYPIKRLTLKDKEWVKLANVSNQSSMFFLSPESLWYMKSPLTTPQFLGAATTKAIGIQFRGDKYMDIQIKTENPPNDVFYWITPKP